MSSFQASKYVEEVQARLGRLSRWREQGLTGSGARDSFRVAIYLWYLLLTDLTTESPGRWGDLWAQVSRCADLEPRVLLTSLDALADAHLMCVSGRVPPAEFTAVLGTVSAPVAGLVTLLEAMVGRVSSRDPAVVRFWRQALSFLLRPDYGLLDGGDDVRNWEARNMVLPDGAPDWLRKSFNFVTAGDEFDSLVDSYRFGHHGPGSVAYRGSRGVRHAHLDVNQKDERLDGRIRNFDSHTSSLQCAPVDVLPAVVTDVPKSWKKRRIITIEPVTDMWLQQGWKEGLFAAIAADSFWSKHVDFSHAEKSWPMVCEGSKTSSFATVDLSAASDSVTLSHVTTLFHDRAYLSHMLEARTGAALCDGHIVEMKMFGPMGNAITFPVETLVFATACVESIKRYGDHPSMSRFRVYGDDIIIEQRYYSVLLDCLRELNVIVNLDKTFSGEDTFRESCGKEFYLGVDVTPLRLPRRFQLPTFQLATDSAISMWVDVANACASYGYLNMRKAMMREVLHFHNLQVPLSEDGSVGFRTFGPANNMHLKTVYSKDWQRSLCAYPALRYDTMRRRRADLALYEWLGRAHAEGAGVYHPEDDALRPPRQGSRVASGKQRTRLIWF